MIFSNETDLSKLTELYFESAQTAITQYNFSFMNNSSN